MTNTNAVEALTLSGSEIVSEKDAYLFMALYGSDRVIEIGNNMNCNIINSNTVKMLDGLFNHQGYLIRIKPGMYENFTIDNGQSGYNRIDTITAHFKTDGVTETHTLEVVKGTPSTGTAVAPTLTTSDLHESGTEDYAAIAYVNITGTTISSVTKANPVRKCLQGALHFVSAD